MAEIVGAIALSHSSLMVSNTDRILSDQADRIHTAYRKAHEFLVNLNPDALVVIGTDHFNTFFVDQMPQLCIGLAAEFHGWADNIPLYVAGGCPELARELLLGLLARSIDVAYSLGDLKLDHSFFGVLHFLTPAMNVPIVPVFQNCMYPPMLSPQRSYDIGVAIGESLRTSETPIRRVAVIGTGGLSHWLGLPEQGRVNSEFDQEFMARIVNGDSAWLRALDDQTISAQAGNGGHELRNWVTTRGCAEGFIGKACFYEAIPSWFAGYGIATFLPR